MSFIKKKEPWRAFIMKAAVALGVIWFAGSAFASRYRIGFDFQEEKCLPGYSFFIVDITDRTPERGGIFAFESKGAEPFFPDGTTMVKIMSAMPGDLVEIDGGESVKVNGQVVHAGLPLTADLNVPSEQFIGSAELSNDEYWFLGESPKSFDSRYWGSVRERQILGRAYPLF